MIGVYVLARTQKSPGRRRSAFRSLCSTTLGSVRRFMKAGEERNGVGRGARAEVSAARRRAADPAPSPSHERQRSASRFCGQPGI